jgi:hypothetical protein
MKESTEARPMKYVGNFDCVIKKMPQVQKSLLQETQ